MLTVFRKNPDNVKREQSFYAEVNGRDVRQDYDGDISIQGQIDMYFIENGEIVVIDYKSDTIDNLAKEQKNYEFQVEIYTKILEKLTGMKIKEMYLYAFLANKETKIIVNSPWVKEHCLFKDDSVIANDREYKSALRMLCSYTMAGKNKHDDVPDGMAMLAEFSESFKSAGVEIIQRPF